MLAGARMQRHFDAVVAGGSIAGSCAAAALAELGWSVLLCEPGLADHRRLAGELMQAPAVAAFAHLGSSNKQTLAELIAKHIPAFERYIPPPRKPWMSEDRRMGIFDAAALALVFFQNVGGFL